MLGRFFFDCKLVVIPSPFDIFLEIMFAVTVHRMTKTSHFKF